MIMAKIIVLGAMKGGVGKSVSTFNLAYSLAELGKKVLVVDFDSQANLTTCMGIEDVAAVPVTIGHLMMNQIGVVCAVSNKKLSSAVGFKGICRKVLILMLVGIANLLDVQVIGTGAVLRTAVIFFYLSNEGVSLLENAAHLGLPIPKKLKEILAQLHDRAESGDENNETD